MAFNSKKIRDKGYHKREKTLEAPEFMLDGFGEDDEKVVIIEGLDGLQFVQTQQAYQKYELEKAFFEGMTKNDAKKAGMDISEYFGALKEETDPTSQKVKEGLLLGIKYPKLTRDDVNFFYKHFPIPMLAIYHEIEQLTEQGAIAEKKQTGSGKTTTSKG